MIRVTLIALAAASSCTGINTSPTPVPTIPTVVVTPTLPDAGPVCSSACELQRSKGCPSGDAQAALEHCVSQCTAWLRRPAAPTPECLALIYTCGEKCAP